MPSDLENLIARYPYWPHAPRGARPEEVARFALSTMPNAVTTELRDATGLIAAVTRVELPWDTEKLGLKAARLAVIIPPEAAQRGGEVVAHAHAEAVAAGYEYLFTRVDAGDIRTVQRLEASGFRTVDAIISQYLRVSVAPTLVSAPGISIREAGPADSSVLAAISDACFTQSRFHSDPAVGMKRAQAIYREWVTNSVNGLNDLTLLATDEETGAVAGFLSCKNVPGSREAFGWGYCRIELVAVTELLRGRNVVRALTRDLIAAAPARGWDLIGIGTQSANVRALRAYSRVGFAPGDAIITLRWRVDAP